ncbi:MAG TPA: hypothetical protein GX405_19500 [Rhizobiales bacterium]|nr:hypothetical protein [Hyphomicrobiales bacterium]
MERLRLALKRRLRMWARRFAEATFDPRGFTDPLPCLWSKGIARFCDARGSEDYWSAATESLADGSMFRERYAGARGAVWVRLGTRSRAGLEADLDRFVAFALPSIREPFVLVTTDGDVSVPSELRPSTVAALLASPFLVAWYTQNADGTGAPRIMPFPIGLDLHTPRPFSSPAALVRDLRRLAERRPPLAAQPLKMFTDIDLNRNSRDRMEAVRMLADCGHVEFQRRRVSQHAIWKRYASFPFVLSLAGNGLDCHRTWEALHLGSIVVTKTSPLDPLFEGLPVVVVDDLAELRDPSRLPVWLERCAPLADPARVWQRLDPAAWMARIRAGAGLPPLR